MFDTVLQSAEWLAATGLSQFIQNDPNMFPALEVLHVLSIALVVGPILLLDLRMIDLGSDRTFAVPKLMGVIVPIVVCAFIAALITGGLLFSSQPVQYLNTPVFLVKMGLLLLAGLNMAIFHRWYGTAGASWADGAPSPVRARIAGLTSLILWLSVLTAGRFIGFVLAI